MQETDLLSSIFSVSAELSQHGLDIGNPGEAHFKLQSSMLTSCPGTLVLPTWANGKPAYEVMMAMGARPSVPDTTFETLWSCTREYYGLTSAALLTGLAGIPISKTAVGVWVHKGSSRTTNITSLIGMRFFPRTLIRQPKAAKLAKATFGTVRVFGVIGRAMPYAAAGMAVFDLVSIGKCAYEAQHGK